MTDQFESTVRFDAKQLGNAMRSQILADVYNALVEKGYDPIRQIIGYLISGDPAYITNHKNARTLIRRVERDDLLEEMLRCFLTANRIIKDDGSK